MSSCGSAERHDVFFPIGAKEHLVFAKEVGDIESFGFEFQIGALLGLPELVLLHQYG